MTHEIGAYLGGIRTVEDMRQRCRMNEVTGCWHWGMACDGATPMVHYVGKDGVRRKQRGRRAALHLQRGVDLAPGQVAFAVDECRSLDCVNPSHCRSGSRDDHGEWLARSGLAKNLPAKIAANRAIHAKRRKLQPEMVTEIRSSPLTNKQLAQKFGVTEYPIWAARNGVSHRSIDSAPNSSVFAWRPAA